MVIQVQDRDRSIQAWLDNQDDFVKPQCVAFGFKRTSVGGVVKCVQCGGCKKSGGEKVEETDQGAPPHGYGLTVPRA